MATVYASKLRKEKPFHPPLASEDAHNKMSRVRPAGHPSTATRTTTIATVAAVALSNMLTRDRGASRSGGTRSSNRRTERQMTKICSLVCILRKWSRDAAPRAAKPMALSRYEGFMWDHWLPDHQESSDREWKVTTRIAYDLAPKLPPAYYWQCTRAHSFSGF
jgi:hypothetical protein